MLPTTLHLLADQRRADALRQAARVRAGRAAREPRPRRDRPPPTRRRHLRLV